MNNLNVLPYRARRAAMVIGFMGFMAAFPVSALDANIEDAYVKIISVSWDGNPAPDPDTHDANQDGIVDRAHFRLLDEILRQDSAPHHAEVLAAYQANLAQMQQDNTLGWKCNILPILYGFTCDDFNRHAAGTFTIGEPVAVERLKNELRSNSGIDIDIADYDVSPFAVLGAKSDLDGDGFTNLEENSAVCAAFDPFVDAAMSAAITPETLPCCANCLLTIITEPQDARKYIHDSCTFALEVKDPEGTVHFQWFKNNLPVGEDAPKLTLNDLKLEDTGQYFCAVADDSENILSRTAQLTVAEHMSFEQEPSGGKVQEGASFSILVELSGGLGTLRYQWFKDDVALGTDMPQLSIEHGAIDASGFYWCRVSDDFEQISSAHAQWIVTPAEEEGTAEGALEGEAEGNVEGQLEGSVEGQAEGFLEGSPEGTLEGEGTEEGQPEGAVEGLGEGQPEGAVEGLGEGQPEGETEGNLEGQDEGQPEGIAEGQSEGMEEGQREGILEGEAEGELEGQSEGLPEGDLEGLAEGQPEGTCEGQCEGMQEGSLEGVPEGQSEGSPEGYPEGVLEGQAEGIAEGQIEGLQEGNPEGVEEGSPEGLDEGEGEAFGYLRVSIEPEVARRDGARWRADGGAWNDSGVAEKLTAGTHVISFSDISGKVSIGCFGLVSIDLPWRKTADQEMPAGKAGVLQTQLREKSISSFGCFQIEPSQWITPEAMSIAVPEGGTLAVTAEYLPEEKAASTRFSGGSCGDLVLLSMTAASLLWAHRRSKRFMF